MSTSVDSADQAGTAPIETTVTVTPEADAVDTDQQDQAATDKADQATAPVEQTDDDELQALRNEVTDLKRDKAITNAMQEHRINHRAYESLVSILGSTAPDDVPAAVETLVSFARAWRGAPPSEVPIESMRSGAGPISTPRELQWSDTIKAPRS